MVRTYLERMPTWLCSSLRDLSPCFQQGAGRRGKPQRVGGRISLSGLVLASRPPIEQNQQAKEKPLTDGATWPLVGVFSAPERQYKPRLQRASRAAVIKFVIRRIDLWRFPLSTRYKYLKTLKKLALTSRKPRRYPLSCAECMTLQMLLPSKTSQSYAMKSAICARTSIPD